MKKMIVASTSTLYGGKSLAYLLDTLKTLYSGVEEVLFIPYARPSGISYDLYTQKVSEAFSNINIAIKGIHEYANPKEAVQNAKGLFTGGGNTFELVNQLYKTNVLTTLKTAIENGTPYLGTSAGSNICGVSMMNTNDMPIVYPPSFTTLGCLSFNINAHYLDPIAGSKHMGETRATRIQEFHVFNDTPVIGLREGSWLEVLGDVITLRGTLSARVFLKDTTPYEIETNAVLKF